MPRIDLVAAPTLDKSVSWVADRILKIYGEAVAAGDECAIALAGGSTPQSLYRLLSSPLWRARLDWNDVCVYTGDERYVPIGDPRSNYRMISETLLDNVTIPARNVHPIPTSAPSIHDDAATYAETLMDELPVDAGGLPVFDLVLLGIGADGYTAGLFPGSPALREDRRLVVGVRPPAAPAPWITLTAPVINAARHVIMLASGPLKAGALARMLARAGSASEIPARAIDPDPGTMTIAADAAACSDLPRVNLRPGVVMRKI